MSTKDVIYFHPLDCPSPVLEALLAGKAVWNAPRPLYGEELFGVDWAGPFRHGRFYSAVDPADEFAATWERKNLELDAWPVRLVTTREIVESLRAYAREAGYPLKELVEDARDMRTMAWELGFPWPFGPEVK